MRATPGAAPSSRSRADGTRLKAFRLLLLALVLLLGWLQYRLWFGSGGHREVEALQGQIAAQQAENLKLRQRNDALAAEVENLKSGEAAVEERARSELGMVKPGETFYRVIEDAPKPAAADPQAPTQ